MFMTSSRVSAHGPSMASIVPQHVRLDAESSATIRIWAAKGWASETRSSISLESGRHGGPHE